MPDTQTGPDKVWDLAKSIGTAMFITWDGERQRARPMAANVRRDEHAIYFLTSEESAKTHQVDKFPVVTLAFVDTGKNDYISLTGRATVSDDRAKIKDLWSPFAKAWWDSPEDPDIRVIKVEPEDAEYWDGPNGPVATVKMLVAAATSHTPDMGDNAKVRM